MNHPFKIKAGIEENKASLHNTNFEEFFPEVNTNTSWRSVRPYVEQALDEYILPYLGEAFYTEIVNKYLTDATLTDSEARAMRFIQICVAWYAIAYAYSNKLDILTDMGNQTLNGEKSMGTPKWAFEKKYGNLLRTADKKLDQLLEFLEHNVADTAFLSWVSSTAYKQGKSDLFHSTSEMNQFHNLLGSRRTYLALIPTLRDVIRYSFMPKFGDLFTEVASEYFNAQLTTNNAKLLPYFQAAAVKLALAMALETQPVAFESDGVRMVTTTEGVEKVQAERVLQLANSCRVLGKQFLDDAESFVLKNLDNYPTYKNSSLNPVSKPVQNQIRISNNRVGAIMLKK